MRPPGGPTPAEAAADAGIPADEVEADSLRGAGPADAERASDAIVAVASPPGIGARSLLRLSGPGSLQALSRRLVPGGCLDGLKGFETVGARLVIDGGSVPVAVTVYHAPRSYTREDMAEVSLPGSPPIVTAALRSLLAKGPGAPVRWARPGEFTLRAFRGGRIDLARAEAVALVIGAVGEEEARASQRSLRGDLGRGVAAVLDGLLEVAALIEAGLDFSEEEDLRGLDPFELAPPVSRILEELGRLRRMTRLRLPPRGACRVGLAGFPNAGKSSLLNALLAKEVALTSSLAGTTRDPIRGVSRHPRGLIEWVDTAGSAAPPEARAPGTPALDPELEAAVSRLTQIELEAADVVVWVAEPGETLDASLEAFRRLPYRCPVLVLQKMDLVVRERSRLAVLPERPVLVSARLRQGLEALCSRVLDAGVRVEPEGAQPLESTPILISPHQESHLEAASESLQRALGALQEGRGSELAAADLRCARGELEAILGVGAQASILDRIFSRFCIGK